MATVNRFEDLAAWQRARELAKAIYNATRSTLFADDPDLKRQIRRASGSVMDNIAEGFGREGRAEFMQYLSVAKGSATEVKSQLYRSADNCYISQDEFTALYTLTDETIRIINGLMKYMQKTDLKGLKYKPQPENLKTRNSKTENSQTNNS